MFLGMRIEFSLYMFQENLTNKCLLTVNNVFLICNEEKSHYVFIKDFNRLMYSKTKHKDRKHFCMSCLQNFTTKF